VAAHDDLQDVLAGPLGQLLEAHVVDDEQVGFEVLTQGAIFLEQGFVLEEIADEIEDGSIADEQVALDRFVADRLGDVGLAQTGRAKEEDIGVLADELTGGQVEELVLGQLWVKAPVKVLEGFEGMEPSDVFAAFEMTLAADVDLVLEDELQELGMAESVGGRLLQADGERGAEAGEAQLAQGGVELGGGHVGKATR